MKSTIHFALIAIACGVLALSSSSTTPPGRSLERGELWGIRGGIANRCCMFSGLCIGVVEICAWGGPGPDDEMNCLGREQSLMHGQDNDDCSSPSQGHTCNESSNTHTCFQIHKCTWNTMGVCVVGGLQVTISAPDWCTDDCV
jgi:hypothetical protein